MLRNLSLPGARPRLHDTIPLPLPARLASGRRAAPKGPLARSACSAARYIRYIYNRVILENATVSAPSLPPLRAATSSIASQPVLPSAPSLPVCCQPVLSTSTPLRAVAPLQVRAAALSSLAMFGAQCPDLRDRVVQLVRRAMYDNDDEVGLGLRGGAVCCVRRVPVEDEALRTPWAAAARAALAAALSSCRCSVAVLLPAHLLPCCPMPCPQVRDRATLYLYQLQRAPQGPESVDPQWRIPAKGLEAALAAYLEQPDTEQPFDLVGGESASTDVQGSGRSLPQGVLARGSPPRQFV